MTDRINSSQQSKKRWANKNPETPRFTQALSNELEMLVQTTDPQYVEALILQRSLHDFIVKFWFVIESSPFQDNWHIHDMCDHLMAVSAGVIRQLILNVPPRHMKSLTVSVFWPAWEWLSNPGMTWFHLSYSLHLSLRDAVKMRRIIEHPLYKTIFSLLHGPQTSIKLLRDQNVKGRFQNTYNGFRVSSSVGGPGIGEGALRIVVDDPHNTDDVHSDQACSQVIDWWQTTMAPRDNDPKNVSRVCMMQRLREGDLVDYLRRNELGWELFSLPIDSIDPELNTSLGYKDPRQPGDLLWATRYDKAYVKQLRRNLGSYNAAAQLDQRPAPKGGGIFKKHWWKRFSSLTLQVDEWLISGDLTFKGEVTSDYCAVGLIARIGANYYGVHVTCKKLEFNDQERLILNLKARFPFATRTVIEDAASGAPIQNRLQNVVAGITLQRASVHKEVRYRAVAPLAEAGQLHLPVTGSILILPNGPYQVAWEFDEDLLEDYRVIDPVEAFIEQCSKVPRAKNDDLADMFCQAVLKCEMEPAAPKTVPGTVETKPEFRKNTHGGERPKTSEGGALMRSEERKRWFE